MAVVGSAEIVVRAITTQVREQIKRAFNDSLADVRKAGEEHGKAYGEGFGNGASPSLRRNITRSVGEGGSGVGNIGRQHGSQYGDRFGDGIRGSNLGGNIQSQLDDIIRQAEARINSLRNSGGGGGGGGGNAGPNTSGWSRGSRVLGEFGDSAVAASQKLTLLIGTSNIVGPAVAGLVGAISSVISGLFALGTAVAQAAPALAALPGLMLSAAQAGGVLKLAMSGVGAAISAGFKPAAATASSAAGTAVRNAAAAIGDAQRNLARARADAARSIATAETNLARAQASAARSIRDAQHSLSEAYRSAAIAAADAARQVKDAETTLAASERALTAARKDLNQAYKDGAEQLQQLGFDAEDAALAEQRASLTLQDAFEAMKAAQALPADDRTRVEAELSYKEAELAYREAKDRASDLAAQQEKAAREGIKGTDAVVSAQEKVNSATQDVKDNEQALADARRAQAQTQHDNIESIRSAQEALADAQRSGAQSVADAQKALADAHRNAARSIADAQEAVAKAHQQAADAAAQATAGANAYQTALDQLSPAAQKFVKYIVSLKDEMKSLKSAAGADLFPKLQTALETIVPRLFPLLETQLRVTGGLLGDAALGISNLFAEGRHNRLGQVLKANNDVLAVFTTRGEGGENAFSRVLRVILRLAVAIHPLTMRFAEWINSLTIGAERGTHTEKQMNRLTNFFNRAGDAAAQLGRIFGNLWDILGSLARAALPAGQGLLDSFEKATQKLSEFLDTPKKHRELVKFFRDASTNFRQVSHLIGVIAGEFLGLGDNRGIGKFAKSLEPAVHIVGDIGDQMAAASPSLGKLATAVARVIRAFSETHGIQMFIDHLSFAVDKIADFVSIPFVAKILAFAAVIASFTRVFSLLLIPIKFIGLALLGGPIAAFRLLGNVFRGVMTAFRFLRAPALFLSDLSLAGGRFAGIAARLVPIVFRLGPIFARLAGPIGIIISLIPLIITGFRALYKHSPQFKIFVDNIVNAIKNLVGWVRDNLIVGFKFAVNFFQTVLLPAFHRFGDAVGKFLIDNVVPAIDLFFGVVNRSLPIIGRIIGDVFHIIGDVIQHVFIPYWTHILIPAIQLGVRIFMVAFRIIAANVRFVFNVIRTVITRVFIPVWNHILLPAIRLLWTVARAVFRQVRDNWRDIINNIHTVWERVLKPTLEAVRTAFENVRKRVADVVSGIHDRWNDFRDIIRSGVEYIRDRLADARGFFSDLLDRIRSVISGIRDRFDDLRDILRNVREDIGTFVGNVIDRFQDIPAGILRAFGGLVGLVRDGLSTFIDFLNNRLIDNINKVTSHFGLTIPHIPRLATGGRVGDALDGGRISGPGGPTDDRVPLFGSRDEYMVRAAAAKRIGYDTLDYVNKYGQLPSIPGGSRKGKNPLIGEKNQGGLGSFFHGAWDSIESLAKRGVGITLEKLIDGVRATMGTVGLGYQAGKGFTIPNLFNKILEAFGDAARAWGEGKDAEADKKAAPKTPAGNVPAYTGKPGGWTYPLAAHYPITQMPNQGHSPSWAVDIGSPTGVGVRAVSAGRVLTAIDIGDRSYGRYIKLSHADGSWSLYAHLERMLVRAGQTVKTGQSIGISDNYGNTTGPHLHFELYDKLRNTYLAMLRRGVRLASGGIVNATPGGILSVIGEAGRNERVEPLDSQGFSKRDRAMLDLIKELISHDGSHQGNFQMIVNPAPGMDERELAEYAFRRAPFALRRGA